MVTLKVPLHYVEVFGVKEFKTPKAMSLSKLKLKAVSIASKHGLIDNEGLKQKKEIPSYTSLTRHFI